MLTTLVYQAHIKLEQYGYAIADATKALELDKDYAKVENLALSLNFILMD